MLVKSGDTVSPIGELITSKHDSATIGSFLLNFKHFIIVDGHTKLSILTLLSPIEASL